MAVSRVRVNNAWVEIVTVNAECPASAVVKIRNAVESSGGIFRQASVTNGRHAERFLYQAFHSMEGFDTIGISHYAGPCPGLCQPFFGEVQFSNVFWDTTYVR